MAILKSIKGSKKKLSFAIPAELFNEFEAIKKEAKTQGFIFDISEKIEKIVAESVKEARKELDEAAAPR